MNVRTLKIDGSRKTNTSLSNGTASEGQHGNTSVLQLDITKTVELLLVAIFDKAQRIPESDWGLIT